ncbi:hypothetical protein MCOR34_009660 [Pyricularia oryzae]|nr:hypothetical protein MCOR34_009660 [Pyricularia oryzae]KAI6443645.1 hypothetical protein MCOR17_011369 [Pyricularia oryzae]
MDIKNNRNSTHDLRETFLNCAALGPIASTLRKTLESIARVRINSRHHTVSTTEDVIHYACLLFQNGWGSEESEVSPTFDFDGPDLLYLGMKELMGDKLQVFNQKTVRPDSVLHQADIEEGGGHMEEGNNRPDGSNISGIISTEGEVAYGIYEDSEEEEP